MGKNENGRKKKCEIEGKERKSKMMWVCEEKSERAKSKSKGDGGKRNKGEGYG